MSALAAIPGVGTPAGAKSAGDRADVKALVGAVGGLVGESALETHIYVVRHGENVGYHPEDRKKGVLCGVRLNTQLTEEGRKQAADQGGGLKQLHISKLFTSSLLCAAESAALTAGSLGLPAPKAGIFDLNEFDFGTKLSGMTIEKREADFGPETDFDKCWEEYCPGTDAEKPKDVSTRYIRALKGIGAECLGQRVAVTAHHLATRACVYGLDKSVGFKFTYFQAVHLVFSDGKLVNKGLVDITPPKEAK